jgi:subtilisin family serine protease
MKCTLLYVAGVVCAAIGGSLAAAPQSKVVTYQPSPPVTASGPKSATVSAPAPDDFYYYNGDRIPLARSETELVVKVRPGAASVTLPASMQVVTEIHSEGRTFQLVSVAGAATDHAALGRALDHFSADTDVEFAGHVYLHSPTQMHILTTDEIVVKLRPGGTKIELETIAASLQLTIEKLLWGTSDEYVLRLDNPNGDPLEKAKLLYESKRFQWAEPNFIRQYQKFSTPNDPLFGQQWHLHNTGQGGGVPGADVKAPAAWNVTTGSSAITIAVIDDGAEMTHEDLAANIFTNPGEIAGNGIDDDHNGFVDDVHGWDFSNNDNDPSPASVDDNHGTAVSGVAAARGNNATGVSGACQNCKILPVKIFSPDYAGDTAVATAIRYAATFADVINNSWGGGGPSATLQSAIQTATTSGRGGKGSVVLFAAGNSASSNFLISGPALPAGTHRFRWTYSKDISISAGDDTAWLAWALFADGTLATFENGTLPGGWSTGGDASWSVVSDPHHSDEGVCLTHAAKAGTITDNQSTYIEVVKTVPSGVFYSYNSVSSESGFDGVTLDIDLDNNGSIDLSTGLISGVPFIDPGVAYPAAFPESIAVGASSNYDCRAHYSQFGPQIAFVAPSSAGPLNLGIETTDRTGSDGYDPSNYTSTFGGTSSATPLSSGIAALLLSRNPSLTLAQVKAAMQNTADKVGPQAYVSGRNDRYGFGRLNASAALLSVSSCATITLSPTVLSGGTANSFYSQNIVASGGTGPYTYAITVGSGPPGVGVSSAGVLFGTPMTAGTFGFSVLATDANGCSGYRAFNVVIASAPVVGRSLYVVTPCRIIDTRNSTPLANLATRDVTVAGACGIPSTAVAVVANITVVSPASGGFLALFPTGSTWPGNSTLNYRTGKTRANNAILTLSGGKTTVLNNGSTQHFIVDVTGYFQ